MSNSVDIHGLVGSIYEAALEPPRWTGLLEEISGVLGAQSAALHFQDQVTGQGWGIPLNVDPAAASLYFGHFATRNPIRGRRNKYLKLGHDPHAWRSRVIHDEHVLPKGELLRTEYYADFLNRFDVHSLLMMGLAAETGRFASLNFYRPRKRAQFGQHEINLATQLQPHLIRSFELSLRLHDQQRIAGGLADFVNRSPNAVFLVDRLGYVRHLNCAAEVLIAAKAGLHISTGVLVARRGDADRLRNAIAAAAGADAGVPTGTALAIFRPERRSLSVIVCPVRQGHLAGFPGEPLVIVCANDPYADRPVPAERLRQLYGLTPAEAKIALELSFGSEPRAIAERLCLTVSTVRFQIARIFEKTGTSRQAELVRLLDQVCRVCLEPGSAANRKN